VVASINANTGGPALSVAGLATALVRNGLQARIATHDYPEHGRQVDAPGVQVVSVPVGTIARRVRGFSSALEGAIAAAAADGVDIIHSHGLWMAPNIYARRAAVRLGLPLVISPRGMLDAWSLERGSLRKGLASRAYERRNLQTARIFHATSDMEADAIRNHGLAQPVAVVPNGVEVPNEKGQVARGPLESRFPELRGRRWLLFMGRLHAKKGLDLLLDAWGRLHRNVRDWHMVICGPDLDGLRSELERRIAGDALAASITLTGMLEGAEKESALANADLFVLPTRSENFGNAVAEALAHGTPVVTTTAAPWSDLVTHRCGWWVPPEAAAIEAALRAAMDLPRDHLAAMGARGRQIMVERYGWDAIATQMARVYAWIAHGGPAPDCVRHS
jgi:glycosyltransferase involved in cell wall biosynthesis